MWAQNVTSDCMGESTAVTVLQEPDHTEPQLPLKQQPITSALSSSNG